MDAPAKPEWQPSRTMPWCKTTAIPKPIAADPRRGLVRSPLAGDLAGVILAANIDPPASGLLQRREQGDG